MSSQPWHRLSLADKEDSYLWSSCRTFTLWPHSTKGCSPCVAFSSAAKMRGIYPSIFYIFFLKVSVQGEWRGIIVYIDYLFSFSLVKGSFFQFLSSLTTKLWNRKLCCLRSKQPPISPPFVITLNKLDYLCRLLSLQTLCNRTSLSLTIRIICYLLDNASELRVRKGLLTIFFPF